MLKSHFPKLLFSALGVALVAFVASMLMPAKYEGFVQILIDQKALQVSQPLTPAERSVSDLVEFPRSRGIVTQVQQLTAYQTLAAAGDRVKKEFGVPESQAEEFSAVNMRDNITVDAEVGSDMISLRVRMSKPDWARAFAGAVYNEFEDQNRTTTIDLAERAVRSLQSQMDSIETDIGRLDKESRDIRQKYNTPNIDNQIGSDIISAGKIQEQYDSSVVDLAAQKDRLAVLESEMAKMPATIKSSSTEALNSNLLNLDAQLANSRAAREQLLERYLPDHENVRAADASIKKLGEERNAMAKRIDASSTVGPNPNRLSMMGEVALTRALVKGLEAKAVSALTELERSRGKLLIYPDIQTKLIEIQRKSISLDRTFMNYADQLQSLRLAQQGRTSPTRLVTPAAALLDPVSPRTLINTIIGFLVGSVFGFVWMVRSESKSLPIRSINQLNALSMEPVYRIIPELRMPFRGLAKAPPEAFETLLVNCLRSDKRPYRVIVVGVVRESGASTAALNYAISAQLRGLRCLVVSSDPKSSIRRVAGPSIPEPPGKTRVQETFEFMNFVDQMPVMGEQGKTQINPVISATETDVTIFDLEPTQRSADYVILAQHVDEVILLVRADKLKTVEFLTAQQALTDAGCPRVTVVLARTPESAVVTDQTAFSEELRALPS